MPPNYKEMYYILFGAMAQATDILVDAQQKCEQMYMNAEEFEPEIIDFQKQETTPQNTDEQ